MSDCSGRGKRERLALGLGLAAVLVVGTPTPASADPARPTNYESEVTEVAPSSDGVTARVVGGDAFLELIVQLGTEVEVPGYQGEPYLRFRDGAVLVNRNSPSHWINQDRYGQAGLPSSASADAVPAWEPVAAGGSYGWHDHRIHWMPPSPPPGVTQRETTTIQDWVVPIQVDNQPVEIRGRLQWVPSISPIPWIIVVGFVTAASIWTMATAWALLLGAGVGTLIGLSQALTSPLGLGGELLAWLPPTLALVGAAAAVVAPHRRLNVGIVSAVLLAVWAGTRLSSLWMPVLPTVLPILVERTGIALAAGTALAALVGAYRVVIRDQPSSPATR